LTHNEISIGELMAQERDLLLPHPGRMECFVLQEASVDKYATFTLGTNHYSVPDHLVGQKIDIKVYANQLKIYHQGKIFFKHARDYGTGQWIITLDHYLRTLERKPGALHGSVALKQAPWEVRQIYESAFRENARDFIEVLQYCKSHEISHERLWRVYQQLLVKCPSDISVDKFKALLGNNAQEEWLSTILIQKLPGMHWSYLQRSVIYFIKISYGKEYCTGHYSLYQGTPATDLR